MPATQRPLRFFLSSTSVDLQKVRSDVLRFLSVIPGDVLAMETFGSDESQPKDFCLAQVAKANFFIGIYAERYGFVDPETGRSLTELEYLQAFEQSSRGELTALLVYMIDPEASWPIRYWEREPESVRKLAELKALLRTRHTVTMFRSEEDLPLLVLRDVIKKLGIGEGARVFRRREKRRIVATDQLARPLGMEYFSAEHSRFFRGRDEEIRALVKQLATERFSLLIGSSGIGKSSLIHGGLLPALNDLGWNVAVVRPMEPFPASLAHQIWSQLMTGPPPSQLGVSGVLLACAMAYPHERILVVFDQFEDLISSRNASGVGDFVNEMLALRHSNELECRLLFSYRADVEADVGPTWQTLSGSAGGLARLYLGALSLPDALSALSASLGAYLLAPDAPSQERAAILLSEIVQDLDTESRASGYHGIYPPFLQMVVRQIVERATGSFAPDELHARYQELGRANRIIADFLLNQLKLLGTQEPEGRRVLIALVSSYGTKAQKKLEDIAQEAGLAAPDAQAILDRLRDLRLVRAVSDTFEIIHDFLARRMVAEIVTSEEIEAKRCRELLSSKVSTFQQTASLLQYREHLYIYRFRERMAMDLADIRYMLRSAFENGGPVFYWLRNVDTALLSEWIEARPLESLRPEWARPRSRPLEEIGAMSEKDLLRTLSSENSVRREAAATFLKRRRWTDGQLTSLGGRKSLDIRMLAAQIRLETPRLSWTSEYRNDLQRGSVTQRTQAAVALASLGSREDIQLLVRVADKPKLSRQVLFSCGLAAARIALREQEFDNFTQLVAHAERDFAEGAICALQAPFGTEVLRALSQQSLRLPEAVAFALSREVQHQDAQTWLRFFHNQPRMMLGSNRMLWALFSLGYRPMLSVVIEAVRTATWGIQLEYSDDVIEIASAEANSAQLRGLLDIPEFWEIGPNERAGERLVELDELADEALYELFEEDDLDNEMPDETDTEPKRERQLGLAIFESSPHGATTIASLPQRDLTAIPQNAYFLRWLAGCIFCNVAQRSDLGMLIHLMEHPYWRVRTAAARKIAALATADDIENLTARAEKDDAGPKSNFKQVLSEADWRLYGSAVVLPPVASGTPGQEDDIPF